MHPPPKGSVAIPVGVLAIASGLWEGGAWLLSFWFRIVISLFCGWRRIGICWATDGLVWTVIGVVEGLDLSAVYARYGDDIGQGGRPAFDPAMMLTLLVFGYCEGRRSARELETACRRDVAYQAICGGMVPDHATIARFRVMIDDVVESLCSCRCWRPVESGGWWMWAGWRWTAPRSGRLLLKTPTAASSGCPSLRSRSDRSWLKPYPMSTTPPAAPPWTTLLWTTPPWTALALGVGLVGGAAPSRG